MVNELITENIWKQLTKTAKESKLKSVVAVAYFGQKGAAMLPLNNGSILVVDASEKAVKTGQTCPEELIKLYNKGVKIFSHANLHAKMFVIGKSLYIGSTNVSGHSASTLKEILFKTTDTDSIQDAKDFIKSLCTVELGPDRLTRLQAMYRPPRMIGGGGKKEVRKSSGTSHYFVIKLKLTTFSEEEEKQDEKGKVEAEKKRILKSRHVVERFKWTGNFKPKRGDIIIQIIHDGKTNIVSPPGILIHIRKWKQGEKVNNLCYVEVPSKNQMKLDSMLKKLSPEEQRMLKRNGSKSKEFGDKISSLWN